MGSMSNTSSSALLDVNDVWYQPSYSGLKGHFDLMLVHITLMVVAWLLLLPIGTPCGRTDDSALNHFRRHA